jgi:hypothetical protein
MLTGDPIDQMKFANIANLFTFMYRLVAEHFGEDFEKFFPCFRPDHFILQDPGEPLLIRAPSENYPLQMMTQFLTNQSAIDRFFSFSLTDDVKSLEKIHSAISHLGSAWIVLHYTSPSREAVKWLSRIVRAFKRADQDSRLVIFVSSFQMLPDSLLSARWVAVDDFPSIRLQVNQLTTQHQVRSRSNPVSMRKFALIAAIVIAALNFRRFICPIGFCDTQRIPDLFYYDIICFARALLDMKLKEIHVKNFIDVLEEVGLASFTWDSIDQIRISAQIRQMIRTDLLSDGYTFFPKEKAWTIATQSLASLDRFPTFATSSFLLIDDSYAVPLRNWSFSRYFASPITKLIGKAQNTFEEGMKMVENALVSIPLPITSDDESKFNTPMRSFLLSEISTFNQGIIRIRDSMLRRDAGILDSLAEDRTPESWLEEMDFVGAATVTKFLSFLKDKAFLLRVWLKGSVFPSPIDIRCISNIRGLFDSFFAEGALAKGTAVDGLVPSVMIANDKVPKKDCLVLANCWLMSAGFEIQDKSVVSGTAPFIKIPQLVWDIVPRENDTGGHLIPVFKSVPNRMTALARDYDRVNGEIVNLVASVKLQATVPEWRAKLEGMAIICHMSEYFG